MVPSVGQERERGPGHPTASPRAPAWAIPAYLASMFVLTVLYLAVPSWRSALWALIGLAGIGGLLGGVLVHRPVLRTPWLLLAGAVALFVVTEAIDDADSRYLDIGPFPTTPDEVALLGYPLAAAGLFLFVRHQRSGRDGAALLDALTVTTALALLAWMVVIWPVMHLHDRTLLTREVSVGYPLGDVLLLAVLARLMAGSATRPPAAWLLGGGALGLLASDLVYELHVVHPSWYSGPWSYLGWIVFYTAWGTAGLHPSMTEVGRAGGDYRGAEISRTGISLLAAASLVTPIVLFVVSLHGSVHEGAVLAAFAAASTVLVLVRLALALRSYRQAIRRAQVVRTAGASLVAAVNEEQIARALEDAGTSLFGDDLDDRGVHLLADCGTPPSQGPERAVFPLVGKATRRTAAVVADGPRDRLAALHDTVETLAGQAALALDRVSMGREIRRLDNESYFRTLIHNAADVFMIVDEQRAVRYASPSAHTLFGGREVTGAELTDLVGPVNAPSALAVLSGTERAPAEWVLDQGETGRIWVEVRTDDLRTDPTVGGVVLTLRDVTDRRRLEGELRHHAYHDPLTGLANRRNLQDRLDRAFERSRHSGSPCGLLLIDLDDFKDVNDTKGHGIGDELLIAVADRLRAGLRPEDLAARLGGDEFAVLVTDLRGPNEADRLARRIDGAFDEPFILADGTLSSTASIGVAVTEGCHSAEELLRNADLALYAAKGDGKRRWRHYDPALHDQAIERAALREHLDRAIAEGSVVLHYQPVVEIGDGRLTGFEALARWPHPVRGMIGPDVFIPLAEETGQILPLGRLLLRQAVSDAAAWNRARSGAEQLAGSLGVPPLHIAVNVSLRQFRDQGFAAETTALLGAAGLEPDLLVLELTESDLMKHHDEQARQTLAVLKEQGVRIAIDDFGTGYSSLSYLRDLPIDILKIDKSFIADIATSAEQAALVEGIIRIADGLGLSVVAEGVETQPQWDMLGGCDCDFGQGYLFSPPMSAEAVTALLARDRDPRLGEER
jgi:diguanylate cyclase (GGDEF)-like protein/PAS domain S-box-containing protein